MTAGSGSEIEPNADRPAHKHVDEDERRCGDEAPAQDRAPAEAVGEWAAEQRSHGPGEEEERQHEGPVRLAVAVVDLPQRDEREEAHVRDAPQADDHEQQDEAAGLGLRRRRSLLAW